MRRFLTLISLLFLCAVWTNTAYAGNVGNPPGGKPSIISSITSLTDSVSSNSLLSFAQTLLGIPYRAASSNPLHGFDCSGFVSYVFNKFNFNVPRSSSDFINVGEKINIEDAKPGDIILFRGTKTHHPHSIGHIGIVYSNDGGLKFIHSTSGKEHCVTISDMDNTYIRRFVQVIRLLKQNDVL